jgi:hypothetical protein
MISTFTESREPDNTVLYRGITERRPEEDVSEESRRVIPRGNHGEETTTEDHGAESEWHDHLFR